MKTKHHVHCLLTSHHSSLAPPANLPCQSQAPSSPGLACERHLESLSASLLATSLQDDALIWLICRWADPPQDPVHWLLRGGCHGYSGSSLDGPAVPHCRCPVHELWQPQGRQCSFLRGLQVGGQRRSARQCLHAKGVLGVWGAANDGPPSCCPADSTTRQLSHISWTGACWDGPAPAVCWNAVTVPQLIESPLHTGQAGLACVIL